MAAPKHNYGLSWIDQDKLHDVVLDTLSKSLGLARPNKTLPPDPFTIVAQAIITRTTLTSNMRFEDQRRINKTLSNAIGGMHQGILGLAPNWEDLGAQGGSVDLKTVNGYKHPRFGKPIVAEVKNRFNTIKASDEALVWDKLDNAAKVTGAQGYLFQITPKTPQRYDREWTPSNRPARSHIRVCDGATAYEIVFGQTHALKELYLALPGIISDIQLENGLLLSSAVPTKAEMEHLYNLVFPV